jgi:hypothetical protein
MPLARSNIRCNVRMKCECTNELPFNFKVEKKRKFERYMNGFTS